MTVAARLGLFAVLLLVVAGGAAAVGAVTGDGRPAVRAGGHGAEEEEAGHGGEEEGGHGGDAAAAPPGLQIAENGLRLELERTTLPRGRRTLRLRLLGEDGAPARDLDVAHEKRLHLILVRRDLSGFQHLHPVQRADGTWETSADLRSPGSWRVLADVTRDGRQTTLGTDLHVPGRYTPQPLPEPELETVTDGGLDVRVNELTAERADFSVFGPLEPYLGAAGHLVALRAGDLAYAHTHPEADRPSFGLELPGAGTYRLFLQVRSGGRVHTAALTHVVPA